MTDDASPNPRNLHAIDGGLKGKEERPEGVERPRIQVNDVPLRLPGQQSLAALTTMNRQHAEKTNRPKLYLRGGDPVRVKRGEEDDLVTQELTVDHVQYELTNAAEYLQMPEKGDPKLVYPPREVARYVLSAPTPAFPKLEGIVHAPVLRRDGSVLKERGYDAATGLILDPPAGFEVDVPDEPTEEDVAAAKKIIGELLNDFPYADKASLANLIAFGITQPLRDTIDGPTPLCAVDKPSPGSGASLLIEVLSHATTGREAGAMGFTERDEEQRKQITSKLRSGDPILFFDNVGTTLDSSSIARALTASLWEDRILGISKTLRVPIRNSWCATGNNLTISTEIARRCFWVRLDARVEKPWERDLKQFSHPDLRGWAKTNRSKILGAFLTIGRYWFAEGQPVPQDAVSLGSFESWSRVMSGVLHAAGIEGFLGNRDQLYEKTTDSTGLWSTFVAAWHEAFADKKFTAAELAGELKLPGNQALREALPEDLSPNDENLARKLGNHFKKQQGVRYGRLYIDKRGEKKRSALWMVVDGGDDRGDGNQIRLIDLAGGSESDGGGESGESAGASSARAGARARTPADVRARTEAAHVDSPESSDSLQKEAQASTNRRGEVSKSSESSPTPEQEAEYASPPGGAYDLPPSAIRRLTAEEAERVQRFIGEGMSPKKARVEMLGERNGT